MRRQSTLTLAACLLAFTATAPTASAEISSAKGKRICKETGETHAPDASVRVNARDIRSTETAYIYRVRLTDAEGARTEMVCTVDKESGEAALATEE